jgi:hypothetical protein
VSREPRGKAYGQPPEWVTRRMERRWARRHDAVPDDRRPGGRGASEDEPPDPAAFAAPPIGPMPPPVPRTRREARRQARQEAQRDRSRSIQALRDRWAPTGALPVPGQPVARRARDYAEGLRVVATRAQRWFGRTPEPGEGAPGGEGPADDASPPPAPTPAPAPPEPPPDWPDQPPNPYRAERLKRYERPGRRHPGQPRQR